MQLASRMWELGHNYLEDENVMAQVLEERTSNPEILEDALINGIADTNDGTLLVRGLPKWADAGFPEVQLSHKYAAALLATDTSPALFQLVTSPWKSFLITLPEGLLVNSDGQWLKLLLVLRHFTTRQEEPAWAFVCFVDGPFPLSYYRYGMKIEELIGKESTRILTPEEYRDPFNLEVDDLDLRLLHLLGRLIVNLCLTMTFNPEQTKEIGRGHEVWARRQKYNRRNAPEPVSRIYRVDGPVNFDWRPAVKDYLTGQKRSLQTQFKVRSHWKMQPHGPKGSLRKLIRIEDYWRGPEDAPILVKPKKL